MSKYIYNQVSVTWEKKFWLGGNKHPSPYKLNGRSLKGKPFLGEYYSTRKLQLLSIILCIPFNCNKLTNV